MKNGKNRYTQLWEEDGPIEPIVRPKPDAVIRSNNIFLLQSDRLPHGLKHQYQSCTAKHHI